jgi:hypothetical protein
MNFRQVIGQLVAVLDDGVALRTADVARPSRARTRVTHR